MKIFFNSAAGHRMIDGEHLVPEFIGRVVLNPTPIVANDGAESDYLSHRYSGALPATNGRAYMVFWTLPVSSADIWWWPQDQFGFAGSGQPLTGIVAFFAESTPAPPQLPVGYVFSLSSVEISSAPMALRLWNSARDLVFDSGRLHLAVQQVVAGLDVAYTATTLPLSGLPSTPAFLVPSIYRDQESYMRPAPQAHFVEWLACYRRTAAGLVSRMVKTNDLMTAPAQTLSYSEDETYGNTNGLVLPIIDATLYD